MNKKKYKQQLIEVYIMYDRCKKVLMSCTSIKPITINGKQQRITNEKALERFDVAADYSQMYIDNLVKKTKMIRVNKWYWRLFYKLTGQWKYRHKIALYIASSSDSLKEIYNDKDSFIEEVNWNRNDKSKIGF